MARDQDSSDTVEIIKTWLTYCVYNLALISSSSPVSVMNALFRYFVEAFPGKVTLRVEDVPDMSGKVVVITGSFSFEIRCLI